MASSVASIATLLMAGVVIGVTLTSMFYSLPIWLGVSTIVAVALLGLAGSK